MPRTFAAIDPALHPRAFKRVAAQLWGELSASAHGSHGQWIRHVRGSLGMTQASLASALGTSQVTVARWETGASKPSPYYRRALDRLFKDQAAQAI